MKYNSAPYLFQEENFNRGRERMPPGLGLGPIAEMFGNLCRTYKEKMEEENSLFKMKLHIDPSDGVELYSYEELNAMTNNFNKANEIQETLFGKLYRGLVNGKTEVLIKTWEFILPPHRVFNDHPTRFINEIEMLMGGDRHSTLMKLKGFCFQTVLAVVYDEKPTKFLSGDDLSVENFGLDKRLYVATQFAKLVVWMHERHISCGFIRLDKVMFDEDFNIKVFDFGFIAHFSEADNKYAIVDVALSIDAYEVYDGIRTKKADVYVFGVLLADVFTINAQGNIGSRFVWLVGTVQGGDKKVVDKALVQVGHEDLANSLNSLIVACMKVKPNERPNMKGVLACLLGLLKQRKRGLNTMGAQGLQILLRDE